MAAPSAAVKGVAPIERPHLNLIDRIRHAAVVFWIEIMLLGCVEYFPWFARLVKPIAVFIIWRSSSYLRETLGINARRLLGDQSTKSQQMALSKSIISNMYGFVLDIGRTRKMSDEELLEEIDGVDGLERYFSARSLKRGAILVTAHLGSFETAAAALRLHEPRIHVVFRLDPMPRFERLRTEQRRRFGLIEAPVDDGLEVWIKLRDALRRNEVVLMQGDRVMPGQKGQPVPFLDGHMMVPPGPVKLALAAGGAPIIPVFAPRTRNGKVRITLEQPIVIDPHDGNVQQVDSALLQLAHVIEKQVRQYPDQWLIFQRALCEDLIEPDARQSA